MRRGGRECMAYKARLPAVRKRIVRETTESSEATAQEKHSRTEVSGSSSEIGAASSYGIAAKRPGSGRRCRFPAPVASDFRKIGRGRALWHNKRQDFMNAKTATWPFAVRAVPKPPFAVPQRSSSTTFGSFGRKARGTDVGFCASLSGRKPIMTFCGDLPFGAQGRKYAERLEAQT